MRENKIKSVDIEKAKSKLNDGIIKKSFKKVELLNILIIVWSVIAVLSILLFCGSVYVADKTKDMSITYLLSLPFFIVFLSTILGLVVFMLKDIIKSKENRLYYCMSFLVSLGIFIYVTRVLCSYTV